MPCLLTISQKKSDVTKLKADTAQSQDNGTACFWALDLPGVLQSVLNRSLERMNHHLE